jgi:hypothetical protein
MSSKDSLISSSMYDSQAEMHVTTVARFNDANPYCRPGCPVLRRSCASFNSSASLSSCCKWAKNALDGKTHSPLTRPTRPLPAANHRR